MDAFWKKFYQDIKINGKIIMKNILTCNWNWFDSFYIFCFVITYFITNSNTFQYTMLHGTVEETLRLPYFYLRWKVKFVAFIIYIQYKMAKEVSWCIFLYMITSCKSIIISPAVNVLYYWCTLRIKMSTICHLVVLQRTVEKFRGQTIFS